MKKLFDLLSVKQNVVITTHANPDGDAIGSSLALYNFLIKYDHNVNVIVPNPYPDFLTWMKGNDDVVIYSNEKEKARSLVNHSSIIFCLDFNNLSRINELGELINLSKSVKVLIDHHLDPVKFYDIAYHNSNVSATAELIYELIEMINIDFLDKDIAECLYTGILTDTGSFKFSSTSSKVHRIVADLIDRGVDSSNVNGLIYDTNSLNRLKLIGFSLSQKLKLIGNNKAAFIVLTRDDLLKFKFEKGDTEGLVNYALSIMGVNMATLIVETRDKIKFSFRSVGNFSVNDFAKQNFNGGGHKNAAGGSLEDKLSVALEKFLIAISKNEKLLNY